MIENWIISAYGNGITITNTAAWFIIQNVYVYPQSQIGDSGTAGLAFSNVTNGLVVNSRIEGFPEGFTTTPQGTASMASSYFTLADNTILGSTSVAIDLRGATNVEIQRNYVSNNPNYPYSSGLHVLYGNNVWAEDNTFHFAGNTAVFFGRSSNFSALGNSVVGNGQAGIQIYQSNSFEVTGNQISDYTGAGIDVSSSNANGLMITNNTVTNSKAGISLESSNGLFINGNTIDRNGIGIDANYPYVPYTGFTTITQNEITNNDVGILLNATHDTLIYQNSFVNNAVQAKDYQGTNNAWDNGSPGGGNYWSDYNGTDADMDGIGDTPYVFSYNQDNYPVMPVSIDGVETCPLCSFSQVLTTSHGNDLVILIVDDCAGCTISDSAGLTYTLRGSISEACVATGSCLTMTEYYAIATAPLQSDTVNVQNSPILVFALHSESNIQFDSASPSFLSCSVADQDQTPCSVSIATAKTDFIIGAVDNFPQSGCSSSAGLTPIVHGAFLGSGYQVQTQPELTSVSYTCIHRSGAYDTEFVMSDAISLGP